MKLYKKKNCLITGNSFFIMFYTNVISLMSRQ